MGCVYRDEQMSEQQMTSHPLYEINPSKGSKKSRWGLCAPTSFLIQSSKREDVLFFFPAIILDLFVDTVIFYEFYHGKSPVFTTI